MKLVASTLLLDLPIPKKPSRFRTWYSLELKTAPLPIASLNSLRAFGRLAVRPPLEIRALRPCRWWNLGVCKSFDWWTLCFACITMVKIAFSNISSILYISIIVITGSLCSTSSLSRLLSIQTEHELFINEVMYVIITDDGRDSVSHLKDLLHKVHACRIFPTIQDLSIFLLFQDYLLLQSYSICIALENEA